MRGGHNEPTHAGKIHSAAEKGNEHGGKKIAKTALSPDECPVDAVSDCRSHEIN
jgi:hypothetical protein